MTLQQDAVRLAEPHGGARATARGRTEFRERLLSVQLVLLDEIVGELVTEDHLVLGDVPGCAGIAAGSRLDAERLAPGVKVRQAPGDALHDAGRTERALEDVERPLRLAVEDLIFGTLLFGRPQVGLERLVPRP